MFDETTTVTQSPRPQETVSEQLRQLMQTVQDLIDLLKIQQDMLRQRGMNLPPGALDGLRQMRTLIDQISAQLSESQIELRQLRVLAETTALITSTLDRDEVLNQVIDRVVQLTGAERGYIVLRNEETDQLELCVARGMDGEELTGSDVIISETVVGGVARTGEPVLTHNALSDPRYQQQQSIVGFALRSILAVPLQVGDSIIGVVYCDNRVRAGLFREQDLRMLQGFANQAAVAIQNARLFQAVRAQIAEITQIRDLMDNVFSSVASGLITLNRSRIITAFNLAAEQITGVRRDEALGQPLDKALPVFNGDLGLKLDQAFELAPQETIEFDLTIDAPERRYWKIKVSILRDSEDRHEGVVMVLDDLTEQQESLAQMKEAQRYMPVRLENIERLNLANVAGQEREISVVFADVRGFTPFSEYLEPEVLMRITNDYLTRSSDAIELYDGVIDKYIGDAVTGLFNTQLNPQEDHAVRAVRAALSMQYDVSALHEERGEAERLFYGIGIHTGRAVLGSTGSTERREFSAIGDAVDFSKLLQENAYGGEILLSAATYERVKDVFDVEAVAPRKTGGREDFTVMYRVMGIKRRTETVQRAEF